MKDIYSVSWRNEFGDTEIWARLTKKEEEELEDILTYHESNAEIEWYNIANISKYTTSESAEGVKKRLKRQVGPPFVEA